MSHDITRDSYARNRAKGYARVRRLQGRMFTDADFNEHVDQAERRLRDFIGDLLGYHAGPADQQGFKIDPVPADAGPKNALTGLTIGPGVYYVDGVRVSNPQPGKTPGTDTFTIPDKQALLVFLDVRSVPVTPLDDPDLLDPGFGGRDSSNREMWDWTVRVAAISAVDKDNKPLDLTKIGRVGDATFVPAQAGPGGDSKTFGGLAFVLGPPQELEHDDLRCVVMPDVEAYTGPENQLYRVEVHRSGTTGGDKAPWFKWSKDNAAPAFAIKGGGRDPSAPGAAADWPVWRVPLESLDALGGLRSLEPLHWVEPLAPDWYGHDERLPLLWVETVDPDRKEVTLSLGETEDVPDAEVQVAAAAVDHLLGVPQAVTGQKGLKGARARLVLWDHEGGDCRGLPVEKNVQPKDKPAAPGIQLEFGLRAVVENGKYYRAGDYWLDPARTSGVATDPKAPDPPFEPPAGPEHVYAPLAVISVGIASATTFKIDDLRKKFDKLGK